MEQRHPIIDPDQRFIINPDNRRIMTSATDLKLIQGDQDSERITFEIPALVEGHPMIESDRIEIHFVNIDRQTKEESKDVYFAEDAFVDGDKVVFSWLISHKATKFYGVLYFLISFCCYDETGNYTYRWNTEICKLLKVGPGLDNKPGLVEEYPDAFEQLKKEAIEVATKDVVKFVPQDLTDEQKKQARENLGISDTDSKVPDPIAGDTNKILMATSDGDISWVDDIVINGGQATSKV